MRRLRVLHLIPSLEGGGAERQLVLLAQALVARGHEVQVASGRGGRHLAELEAVARVDVLPSRGSHDLRLPLRVIDLCRERAPDLVQTWLTQMDVLGGFASRVLRLPWVLSERSVAEAYPRTWKNVLRGRLGRRAEAIVANSAAGARYWNDAGARGMVRVIPNAVAAGPVARVPRAHAEAPLVLFAGRLAPEKNLEQLVEAFALLRAERAARLEICGDGPERARLAARIAAAKLGGDVRLAGYCDDLPQLMRRAAVLVSPSRFEGHPNVVLEAMAVRCPLVVTRIPAHQAILDEASAAFCDPGDASSLAAALRSVLADPSAAARRAETAAARIGTLDIERIATRWEQVYFELSPEFPRMRGASAAATWSAR